MRGHLRRKCQACPLGIKRQGASDVAPEWALNGPGSRSDVPTQSGEDVFPALRLAAIGDGCPSCPRLGLGAGDRISRVTFVSRQAANGRISGVRRPVACGNAGPR